MSRHNCNEFPNILCQVTFLIISSSWVRLTHTVHYFYKPVWFLIRANALFQQLGSSTEEGWKLDICCGVKIFTQCRFQCRKKLVSTWLTINCIKKVNAKACNISQYDKTPSIVHLKVGSLSLTKLVWQQNKNVPKWKEHTDQQYLIVICCTYIHAHTHIITNKIICWNLKERDVTL